MSIDVSMLLDSQLSPEEVPAVLRAVGSDPQLRDRYTVYGLVGDALRGLSVPDDGFSVRIFNRLRREGIKIEPGFDPLADGR